MDPLGAPSRPPDYSLSSYDDYEAESELNSAASRLLTSVEESESTSGQYVYVTPSAASPRLLHPLTLHFPTQLPAYSRMLDSPSPVQTYRILFNPFPATQLSLLSSLANPPSQVPGLESWTGIGEARQGSQTHLILLAVPGRVDDPFRRRQSPPTQDQGPDLKWDPECRLLPTRAPSSTLLLPAGEAARLSGPGHHLREHPTTLAPQPPTSPSSPPSSMAARDQDGRHLATAAVRAGPYRLRPCSRPQPRKCN